MCSLCSVGCKRWTIIPITASLIILFAYTQQHNSPFDVRPPPQQHTGLFCPEVTNMALLIPHWQENVTFFFLFFSPSLWGSHVKNMAQKPSLNELLDKSSLEHF